MLPSIYAIRRYSLLKSTKCKRLSLSMTKLRHERRPLTLMYQSGGNEISVNEKVYINEYMAAFNVCLWFNGVMGETDLTIGPNNHFERVSWKRRSVLIAVIQYIRMRTWVCSRRNVTTYLEPGIGAELSVCPNHRESTASGSLDWWKINFRCKTN